MRDGESLRVLASRWIGEDPPAALRDPGDGSGDYIIPKCRLDFSKRSCRFDQFVSQRSVSMNGESRRREEADVDFPLPTPP